MSVAHHTDVPIRDAATVILVRRDRDTPHMLVGQRGSSAVFMPGKFVFPGGAVDPEDYDPARSCTLPAPCHDRLMQDATEDVARALPVAALRELREETGLRLPNADTMRFVFRAITPPRRPRRFDARFFLCDAKHVTSDLDDFSEAEDELSFLQWAPLSDILALDLPFVTKIVLAEIRSLIDTDAPPLAVPFYNNRTDAGEIRLLK